MRQYYGDILDRIEIEPDWFDEAGVPRYAPFRPNLMANIYATEAVLARIACQGCGRPFDVSFSQPRGFVGQNLARQRQGPAGLLRHEIWSGGLFYGDPPNVRCCAAGASMSAVSRRVLEYWVKPHALGEGIEMRQMPNGRFTRNIRGTGTFDWRREPELEEIDISPDWAR